VVKRQNGTDIVVAVLKTEMGHLKEMHSSNAKKMDKIFAEFKKSVGNAHKRLDDHIVDAPKVMDAKDQEVRGFVWKLVTVSLTIIGIGTGLVAYFV